VFISTKVRMEKQKQVPNGPEAAPLG